MEQKETKAYGVVVMQILIRVVCVGVSLCWGMGVLAQAPETINVFIAGDEEIEGVENASEQYAQYREQNGRPPVVLGDVDGLRCT